MAKPSDLAAEIVGVVDSTPVELRTPESESARRVEALSLRLAGLSFEQIGKRLGISSDGAEEMIHRSLSRAENRQVEAMRELEGQRLDRVQAAIWTEALNGDLKAVSAFLRLSERRARLYGLDAPTKIDLAVNVRQEMEQALTELEAVVLGEVVESVVVDSEHERGAAADRGAEE